MDKADRRRLERLRDDLDEMLEGDARAIGYGVITPSFRPEKNIGRSTWEWLAKRAELRGKNQPLRLRPDPWIDPAPNGQYCLLWWGNTDGIQEHSPGFTSPRWAISPGSTQPERLKGQSPGQRPGTMQINNNKPCKGYRNRVVMKLNNHG